MIEKINTRSITEIRYRRQGGQGARRAVRKLLYAAGRNLLSFDKPGVKRVAFENSVNTACQFYFTDHSKHAATLFILAVSNA